MAYKMNIVSVGDLTVDLVMPVTFPVEPGSSQEVPFHQVEPGGSCNFLIAARRIGGQDVTVFATGPLGADLYGREVIDTLRRERIDVDAVMIEPGSVSTVVLVLMQPDSGKFAYVWRGGKGNPLALTREAKRTVDEADALFMQGYTLCEPQIAPLLDYAFDSGRPIWFDVGPAMTMAPEPLREKVRRHAYAVLSTEQEFPEITAGKTDREGYEFLLECGVQIIIVKRGGDGCRIVTRDRDKKLDILDVPAFKVPVRDLVGAGDCFNATFIYGSLLDLPLKERGQLANAAGAAKIQKLGTGRAMPDRGEVRAVLKANAIDIDF
jgi:sugar/nucleoside kinase (ribokinase family)